MDYTERQIAGREGRFRSEIREARESLEERTRAFEHLAVEFSMRGLSVCDIEDAFTDSAAVVAHGRLRRQGVAVTGLPGLRSQGLERV